MISNIKFGFVASLLAVSALASTDVYADAVRGEALYTNRCTGCQSVEFNRTSPLHRGVVGRRVGGVASFRYSPALKGRKQIWNTKLLKQWLANPEALFQGQDMGYAVVEARDRGDLIDYLTTLRAKPYGRNN